MTSRLLGLAALSLLAACNGPETVNPAPATTTSGTTTTTEPKPPDAAPQKRTILQRSPVGAPANNLLLDGDFELSVSPGGGQYGWRMFNSSGTGELAMSAETGGLCRSGLTCVRLQKGQLLFGRGTAAPAGKPHVFSMYSKVPEGVACHEVDLLAVRCDSFQVLDKASPEPELDGGWCRYTGTFGPSQSSICFYIQNSLAAEQTALVDAAVLAPNDGTVPYKSTPMEPLSAETLATMARLQDYLRRTTLFGQQPITSPPPRL